MTTQIDEIEGWPISGYRCNGCTKYTGKSKRLCLFGQCPVYLNLKKLNPTLSTKQVSDIIEVKERTIRSEVQNIEGAYMSGCWQIPKEALNKPPLSEIQKGKRRR